MTVLGIVSVIALYAAGAWRIELIRQAPQTAICTIGHCVPVNSTFSALR